MRAKLDSIIKLRSLENLALKVGGGGGGVLEFLEMRGAGGLFLKWGGLNPSMNYESKQVLRII